MIAIVLADIHKKKTKAGPQSNSLWEEISACKRKFTGTVAVKFTGNVGKK